MHHDLCCDIAQYFPLDGQNRDASTVFNRCDECHKLLTKTRFSVALSGVSSITTILSAVDGLWLHVLFDDVIGTGNPIQDFLVRFCRKFVADAPQKHNVVNGVLQSHKQAHTPG